jgi:hypothetical protein
MFFVQEQSMQTETSGMQIETNASSTKGFAFDLNFPPALDDDDA